MPLRKYGMVQTAEKKTALVTGASSGIGFSIAEHLAQSGWTVFAGIRSEDDAARLSEAHNLIRPVRLDVTDDASILAAKVRIAKSLDGKCLAGLVNNAGIAQMGPLALQPMDEIRAHFEVNTFGLIAVTKAFLPLIGMDETLGGPKGRIVNVTSVGGEISAPFLGAYCATKHAVESFTDSLRREMIVYGIDAIAVGPGSVKTPIWDKAENANQDARYEASRWGLSLDIFADVMLQGGKDGLSPETIADVVETALTARKPKARYAPVPNKFTNWVLPRLLPKRVVDGFMAKRYGLKMK